MPKTKLALKFLITDGNPELMYRTVDQAVNKAKQYAAQGDGPQYVAQVVRIVKSIEPPVIVEDVT